VSETKYLDCQFLDLKRDAVATTGEFSGHGAVFSNVDQGGDIIAPGAFRKTLRDHSSRGTLPPMLWAHDSKTVIGRWDELREDDHGLFVKGTLAPTDKGQEVRTLLKMGAVNGMSIGYLPTDSEFNRAGNRVLNEIDLHEISIVAMPMNRSAVVTTAKEHGIESITDYEKVMKNAFKWSRTRATRFASATYKHFVEAEAGGELAEISAFAEELDQQNAIRILETAAQRMRSN
jgi:HK97 family phage prohead protease